MVTELERQSHSAVPRIRALIWSIVDEMQAEGYRPEQITLAELKQRLARRLRESWQQSA